MLEMGTTGSSWKLEVGARERIDSMKTSLRSTFRTNSCSMGRVGKIKQSFNVVHKALSSTIFLLWVFLFYRGNYRVGENNKLLSNNPDVISS